ncbi:MAG: protein phosphatase 2C domain-containing protein [Lachnospiraceae bacterium]|nr:serine/threonine-protein phosphatase [Lachnospiraceae bacterium]MCR4655918.1 protein phosphatase 2C domain-containing protein [Lachnospiraceae bacterium]HAG69002.1 serine/threonine-protein phosphatase [Lachnospiraceae bacterium]
MAKFNVEYYCVSNIGKIRKINQDNFIAGGVYLRNHEASMPESLHGGYKGGEPLLVGVFDGMGGEECGETASLLASETAAEVTDWRDPIESLLSLCEKANEKICRFARENSIESMGTTGAMLVFDDTGITLCNIGDSRIFRFASGELVQISVDHTAPYNFGGKPPLSQNLGIPPEEMRIEPYVAKGNYQDGDIYLISSDGLTDMVTESGIARILSENDLAGAEDKLLQTALENGGRDNVTIILCEVKKRKLFGLFG